MLFCAATIEFSKPNGGRVGGERARAPAGTIAYMDDLLSPVRDFTAGKRIIDGAGRCVLFETVLVELFIAVPLGIVLAFPLDNDFLPYNIV